MCVCVRVCASVYEREGERDKERDKEINREECERIVVCKGEVFIILL